MSSGAMNTLGLTAAEFIAEKGADGVRRERALAAYRRLFRIGAAEETWLESPRHEIAATIVEGRTTKFTLRLCDGLETESVLIPMRHRAGGESFTLCVSSQVGCAMGCAFCETARMGLLRDLSAAEIVAQWHAARFAIGSPVKNLVFMGMGEPMDNLAEVIQAIRVLADHDGAALAVRNVSVSTVGRVDGIARLAEFARRPGYRKLNLAVSVNAPNDAIRSAIMPMNRAAPMAALMEAMLAWPRRRNGRICVEYVLIPEVNDAVEHADELCEYLRPLCCTVNVIPYNPRRDSPWPAPSEERVSRFVARVMSRGQFVKRRETKGRSVMAACGQLGNPAIRRRRLVAVGSAADHGHSAGEPMLLPSEHSCRREHR